MEYREATDRMIMLPSGNPLVDDLRPDDFEKLRSGFSGTWGPHRVGKFVQLVRSVFKFGQEIGLLEWPVLFRPQLQEAEQVGQGPEGGGRCDSGERRFNVHGSARP